MVQVIITKETKTMSQGSSHSKELGRDTRRITAWAIIPLLILRVPFIAMQLTDEVQWDVADFAFAGVLLAAAGIIYALLTPKNKTARLRMKRKQGSSISKIKLLLSAEEEALEMG